MAIETKKPDLTKDSYVTAGTGALVGGVGAYGAINSKLTRLAKETVDAFSGKAKDCDAFVKKHDELIGRAVDSRKGFFGKINSVIDSVSKSGDDAIDAIAKGTSDVVDSYRNLAAKRLNTQLSGEALTKGIDDLGNKLISRDVLKSFKDVTRFENIVKISGFAVAGAIGACILKEVIKTVKDKKAAKALENPAEKITKEENTKKSTKKSLKVKKAASKAAEKPAAEEIKPEVIGIREDGTLYPMDTI